ncbi:oligosaccharide flippase family protein [Spirosoma sp. BT702]|uniref:Oligosaccharide flippase family protein n=1 Tax=Spirosoma profusum TaxID=2771354 RepID=A0A926XXC0_9BACT|nr:oligosaccharide flippase family protein [Spirosoma profusum]MBD2699632.1 oligosaccharide flippase family protein [Spirosoma profusum]
MPVELVKPLLMFKSSFFNLLGGVVRLIVATISIPLLVKALGVSLFGLYSIVNAITIVISLAEWSISISTTVHVADNPNKKVLGACFWVTMMLGLVLGCLIYLSSYFVQVFLISFSPEQQEQVSFLLKITSLTTIFRIPHQFFIGLEQAYNRYDAQNLITTVYNLLFYIGSIFIAGYTHSLTGIFIWQFFIMVLGLIMHIAYTSKSKFYTSFSSLFSWSGAEIKKVLSYCSSIWPSSLGAALFTQGDRLLIGRLLGSELTGIYAAATSITTQINNISALPAQPLSSYIKSKDVVDDTHLLNQTISNTVYLNVFISVASAITIICFSVEINLLILGNISNYENASLILPTLAGIYAVYSFNAVGYYILFGVFKQALNTIIILISGIVTLILIYLLTMQIGILGAAIGNIGFWLTLFCLVYGYRAVSFSLIYVIRIYIFGFLSLILSFGSLYYNELYIRMFIFLLCMFLLIRALPTKIVEQTQQKLKAKYYKWKNI